jgi:hypothetical protein
MISNNDKINALVSLKSWAVERQLYELAGETRSIERKLLESTEDYVKVIKDIEYLSSKQKQYLLESELFKIINKLQFDLHTNPFRKEHFRDLKIILIQN